MVTGNYPSFAELLKRTRRDAGLTQEELAERAGLSVRAISDLERGVNRTSFRNTAERLVEALGLPADERSVFEQVARGRAPTRPVTVSPPALGPPLVGRDRELEELDRYLTGEQLPVLMVAGEPGIGKTRLLGEAARRATMLGYTVLHGGCQRRSGQQPYSPVLEALAGHVAALSATDLAAALEGCFWLPRLLPEVAGTIPVPAPTLPDEHERRLIFAAVARFLRNVAGPMGTLLVLDDLQWAGGDVFDLLSSLVSGDVAAPLRLLGAFRQTEVDARHPLFVALADLSRAHLVRQLDLGPLSNESAVALLAGVLDNPKHGAPDRDHRIVERTGGVPFFLVSYAYSLKTHSSMSGDDLPWDVTQILRQRIGALPEPAQELLEVASVVGRTVPHRLLVEATGWSEESVLTALDAAARAGLLVEAGRWEHRFAHDVIREAVEGDLSSMRRGMLHQRVGEALERLSGTAVELAWHFRESHEPERALPYLVLAGDEAEAVFAHEEAERQYGVALDLMRSTQKLDLEAITLEKLGTVQIVIGRYDWALPTLEQSLRTYALAGDLEGERRAAVQIGRTHGERGTPRQGLDRIRPLMVRFVTGEVSPGLGKLHLVLARLWWDSGRPSESLAAAESAAELGRALGDDSILARADYWRRLALWQLGRPPEESPTWSDPSGARDTRVGSDRGYDLPVVVRFERLSRGAFRETREQLLQALELDRTRGDRGAIAWDLSLLGFCLLMLSDWDNARSYMHQALEIAGALGSTSHIAPLMDLGLLSVFEGDSAGAARYLHAAAEQAERKGDLYALRITTERLARVDLLNGNPEGARERLLPLLDPPGADEFRVSVPLSTLALAYLELGQIGRAEASIADAIRREVPQQSGPDLACALSVQGRVFMHQGRWDLAEQCLERALFLYGDMTSPYHAAQVECDLGMLHVERGEFGMARESLTAASAVFARLKAKADLERARQALAALDLPRE